VQASVANVTLIVPPVDKLSQYSVTSQAVKQPQLNAVVALRMSRDVVAPRVGCLEDERGMRRRPRPCAGSPTSAAGHGPVRLRSGRALHPVTTLRVRRGRSAMGGPRPACELDSFFPAPLNVMMRRDGKAIRNGLVDRRAHLGEARILRGYLELLAVLIGCRAVPCRGG
jgi:hypothetical protein